MPQSSKNGKEKMNFKNFNDLCTIFSGVCADIDDTDDPVTGLLGQLRETQENVSGLNESDLTAMKVVNLLLPAMNVITSKTVGKYVKNQDVKINTICSVVRQNTYAIDKQNQYSRRENIRITGLPENDDVDDFDTFKQLCGKMGIEVKKEDIVACDHRVGAPGKKKPRT